MQFNNFLNESIPQTGDIEWPVSYWNVLTKELRRVCMFMFRFYLTYNGNIKTILVSRNANNIMIFFQLQCSLRINCPLGLVGTKIKCSCKCFFTTCKLDISQFQKGVNRISFNVLRWVWKAKS